MGFVEIFGWAIATLLVVIAIAMHYELIRVLSDTILPWALRRVHDRRAIMIMIGVLMLGHIAEIWMFAFAMMAMAATGWGHLTGNFDGSLDSFVYFSAVSYTSLGYGDIAPQGVMRALAVSEVMVGLLMVAWSASFTYLKMEQIWNLRRMPKE